MKTPLILFFILFQLTALAQRCDKTVSWGHTSFCLPEIAGLKEGYSNSNIQALADLSKYKGNQILGVYLLPADFESLTNGASSTMKEYCKIYGVSQLKDYTINQTLYNELEKVIRSKLTITEEFADKIEEYYDIDELDTTITLENYSLNETSNTTVMLTNMIYKGVISTQIITISYLLVRERVVCLAYYVDFEGKDSIKRAKRGNNLLLLSIQNANR